MQARIIAGTFFALMGVLFGTLGVVTVRRAWRFRTQGKFADGVVVDLDWTPGRNGMHCYPKVEFETASGQKTVFTASTAWNTPPGIGRSVPVVYLPGDPSEAEIPSAAPWIASLVCLIFAAGFLACSAVAYLGILSF